MNAKILGTAIALVIVAVVGVFLAFNFVEDERARNLQAWQIRLGIVADSRTAAVNDWIDGNFAALRELSENQSLQLYMTELALAEQGEELAEGEYLQNLLFVTAERLGFTADTQNEEAPANVERVGLAGIALVEPNGNALISSPGMPPASPAIRTAIIKALTGQPALVDMYESSTGTPAMGFVLPVFALQGETTEGIGAVVGVRLIDDSLYGQLDQPGELEETTETYLVRVAENLVEYLSPLADGTAPLKRKLSSDTPELAAAYLTDNTGGFATLRDYVGVSVLATSRSIAGTPWTLIRKVSSAEALSETDTRLRTILIVFVLIIVGVGITIVAVWRHGSSMRAAAAAEKFKIAAERFENLIQFNRVLMDSQPTHVVCINPENKITFSNRPFADAHEIDIRDIRAKPLSSVVGPSVSNIYTEINKRVVDKGERESHVHNFDVDGENQVIQSEHVKIPGDLDHPPAALMVLNDITELTREREAREEAMRQLIGTLVSVVDRRDPFSANHSARVAEVATAIGKEMGFDETGLYTVDIAGNLMNLGKIFIATEILTKTEALDAAERALLHNSFVVSAELLENVEFDGPVVDTVRQIGENWDGSGALGLAGENILETARVVAVANTFVGMVSARAYRDAMDFEKVSAILLEESEKKFDRRAVVALLNVLENRDGRENWAHYRERPETD